MRGYIFLLLVPVATVFAQTAPRDSLLLAAQDLYNAGRYTEAELEARRMIESLGPEDSSRIGPERLIAFSLVALGKSEPARDHFAVILRLDPSFDLDPLLTSPKILAAFREAKATMRQQPRSATNTPGAPANLSPGAPTFRTMLFPGWEQLYQRRETEGYVFLGSGAVALGSGIAFEFLRASARKSYLDATAQADIDSKYETYNRYYKAERISFILFAVVYVASEVDVLTSGFPVEARLESSSLTLPNTRISFAYRF